MPSSAYWNSDVDRKSTRLNSSHQIISYAVFCLKKQRAMITIAVGNQKGGVGKTTTAVALGQYFARRGKRVLIVDLDAQGHVAESLGVDKSGGLFRLICQGLAVEQVAENVREDLDIIANDHTAEQVKAFAAQSDFRAYILAQALGEVGASGESKTR